MFRNKFIACSRGARSARPHSPIARQPISPKCRRAAKSGIAAPTTIAYGKRAVGERSHRTNHKPHKPSCVAATQSTRYIAATQLIIIDDGFENLWPRAPYGALAIGYYFKRCSAALLPLRGPSARPPNCPTAHQPIRPSPHPLYFMSQQCTRAIPGLQQREAEGAEAGGEFGLAAGTVAVADFVEGGRMVHFRQMSQLVEYHEFAQFCR